MKSLSLGGVCLCALVVFLGEQGLAAYGNTNSILIGDQAAGMGGAATAVAEDTSAAPWYNPAGLAAIPGERFSAAVGIYKKFETRFGENEDLVSSALRANQGFFRALPSSTSSVIRPRASFLGDTTLAFSILVPEFDQFRGEIHRSDLNTASLSFTDESLWAGAALARPIGVDRWAGVSLYYAARSMSKTIADRTYRSPTDFRIYNEDRVLTQNAVVLVAGYLQKLNEQWSWGTSFRFPSLHVMGRATFSANTFESGVAEQPVTLSSLDSKARIPARWNVGVSSRLDDKWLLAVDLNLHFPESYDDLQTDRLGIAESIEHRPTLNWSVGTEYRWTDAIRCRVGLFSNYSSHPSPDRQNLVSRGDHVDQLGFSANAAFRSGAIEYTFGGYYSGGRGESLQRIDHQAQVIEKTQNIFTMLVGTSYYF